jgi:Tfp pilus assembly protein PilO
MLEKLPFYGQVVVFAGLAVAVVIAAYALWPNLGDMREDIRELEDQFTEKQAEIRKGQAAEQRLPELEREIEAKKTELADLEQILPSDRETGDLLRYVKNLGDQSNSPTWTSSPSRPAACGPPSSTRSFRSRCRSRGATTTWACSSTG